MDIEIKKDCFAYKEKKNKQNRVHKTCTALKKLYCKDEKCKFYKTKKQFEEDAEKCYHCI